MSKKKFVFETQYIANGSPCQHDDCGKMLNKECPYCGRVNCRGIVHIEPRSGYVHLERLNSTYKKEHNRLSPEEQETNIIKLRFSEEQF